eukprot:2056595-Pyramimonas_sp.AAC.1
MASPAGTTQSAARRWRPQQHCTVQRCAGNTSMLFRNSYGADARAGNADLNRSREAVQQGVNKPCSGVN